MANEVAKLLDAGVAPVEEIDRAMRLGAGFPEGPATIADKRGVGRLYRTLTDLYAGGEAPRYEPSPYLADLAESGAWFRGGG
jgi:enoyl-CoA hydratase/3-hydroxyacyl-CoA dehydrogenase